jgi:hypothetical protein
MHRLALPQFSLYLPIEDDHVPHQRAKAQQSPSPPAFARNRVIGILVHSLVDFNLQIPANAALFYVLTTIAAAPPLLQRTKKPRPVPAEEQDFFPASEVV